MDTRQLNVGTKRKCSGKLSRSMGCLSNPAVAGSWCVLQEGAGSFVEPDRDVLAGRRYFREYELGPLALSSKVELLSIPVVLGLERSVDRNVDVLGLLGRKLGELDAELLKVQPRDLFVQRFGQHVDAEFVFLRFLP